MKNCPFCGSDSVDIGLDAPHVFFVSCENCEAHGPVAASASEAVRKWNEQDATDRILKLRQFAKK